MSSLTKCLKKMGLSKHEAAILRGSASQYTQDGMDAQAAAIEAVVDYLDELASEREEIVKQIEAAGGQAPAAPELPSREVPRASEALAAEAPAPEKKPEGFGATNKVFTADKAARARELLKKKLGNLNAGLDPEVVQAGIELAGFYIEGGARSFAAYSKRMIEELGDGVRAYLKSWYAAVYYYPGFENAGMDDPSTIKEAAYAIEKGQQQESREREHQGNDGRLQTRGREDRKLPPTERREGAESRGRGGAESGQERSASVVPARQTGRLETASNGINAAIQSLGDFSTRQAIIEKGFDSLSRDRQQLVLSRVVASVRDEQVRRAIIEAIPVSVMNDLVGEQFSAEELRRDDSVFVDKLTIPPNHSVGHAVVRFINEMASLVPNDSSEVSAGATTEAGASRGGAVERGTARGASDVRHVGSIQRAAQAGAAAGDREGEAGAVGRRYDKVPGPPFTTPGTRVEWHDAQTWLEGWRTLKEQNRKPSSQGYANLHTHWEMLAAKIKWIVPAADLKALRGIREALTDASPDGLKAGPERTLILNEINNDIAKMDGKVGLGRNAGIPADWQSSSPYRPLVYASGMSRAKDFKPAFAAGKNVGVDINELSNESSEALAQAVIESDGYVFVDSGAFSVFRANLRNAGGPQLTMEDFGSSGKALNFDEIFRRYEWLAKKVATADDKAGPGSGGPNGRLFYVMPDIVGDQADSLELAKRYKESIGDFIGFANAIIPIQVGEKSLADAYVELTKILGREDLVLGIPSNERAAPPDQVRELFEKHGDTIYGVHFLGAASQKKLGPLLQLLRDAKYDGPTSADANILRSNLWGDTDRATALRKAIGMPEPVNLEYGDLARAPDGKVGILRGAGGMGSGRVRLVTPDGTIIGYYSRGDLVPAETITPEMAADEVDEGRPEFKGGKQSVAGIKVGQSVQWTAGGRDLVGRVADLSDTEALIARPQGDGRTRQVVVDVRKLGQPTDAEAIKAFEQGERKNAEKHAADARNAEKVKESYPRRNEIEQMATRVTTEDEIAKTGTVYAWPPRYGMDYTIVTEVERDGGRVVAVRGWEAQEARYVLSSRKVIDWTPGTRPAGGLKVSDQNGRALVLVQRIRNVPFEEHLDSAAHAAATSPQNDKAEPTQAQKEAGNYEKGHVRVAGLDVSIENPEGSVRTNMDARLLEQLAAGDSPKDVATRFAAAARLIESGRADEARANLRQLVEAMLKHAGGIDAVARKAALAVKDWLATTWASRMTAHYGYIRGTEGADGEHVDVFIKPGTPLDYDGPVFVIDQTKKNGHHDEHKVMLGWPDAAVARASFLANYDDPAAADRRVRAITEMTLPELKAWLSAGDMKRPASSATMPEGALDVAGSRPDLERDRPFAAPQERVGQKALFDEPGRDDRGPGGPGGLYGSARDPESGDPRLSANGAAPRGERGDQPLHRADGEFGTPRSTAGSGERGGGPPVRDTGVAADQERGRGAREAARTADAADDIARKVARQREANKLPVVTGDIHNIRATLPFLLEGQQEDVKFAEDRFAEAKGRGVLFTNGTGTGKTFTGLGIINREVRRGSDNILVVVPSDKIARDWSAAADHLGIALQQLPDTQSNGGKGPVVTTYANFYQNNALVKRDWSLVVFDEAQLLNSNMRGEITDAQRAMWAVTRHPRDGAHDFAVRYEPELWAALQAALENEKAYRKVRERVRKWLVAIPPELRAATKAAQDAWDAALPRIMDAWDKRERSKVVFLSATPWAYVRNTRWSEGYLFDYPAIDPSKARYNAPKTGEEAFLVQHFGYRFRTGKLTEPEPGVDRALLEINFNQWLKDQKVLSSRLLDVPHDYDRRFILNESALGRLIDDGIEFLQGLNNPNESERGKWTPLWEHLRQNWKYHDRMYLLEALKARDVVPMVREHIKLGRKVVVFHGFNKGGGFHPFRFPKGDDTRFVEYSVGGKPVRVKWNDLVAEFEARRPDLVNADFDGIASPIETFKREFGDKLALFNGLITPKARAEMQRAFNADDSGIDVILVQQDAGGAGLSLHDATGRHQRALINLGMPIKPVTAIQTEGRIYRVGQKSDAIFRYLNTGTNFERWTFASVISERAGTAENLALGAEARALKDAFIEAFQDSGQPDIHKNEGRGGKHKDRVSRKEVTPFDKAITYFYAKPKRTEKRDHREGIDYFATPEPLAFKMVEWAGVRPGDELLEPSAGHGAIARFFPRLNKAKMIEPSFELGTQAALVSGADLIAGRFEDHHITNKYDVIVMNPPFGHGGATAIAHLDKAAGHLRDGGRLVALLPDGGGMASKAFDAWLNGEQAKDGKNNAAGMYLAADIKLPRVTFSRAGTSVTGRVVVLDRINDIKSAQRVPQQVTRDFTSAETFKDFFDRLRDATVPERPDVTRIQAATEAQLVGAEVRRAGEWDFIIKAVPLKNDETGFTARPVQRIGQEFREVAHKAELAGGSYSSGFGTFVFLSAEALEQFFARLSGTYAAPADTTAAAPAAAPTAGLFTIKAERHTQSGKPIWVARFTRRVESDEYLAHRGRAQRLGGYYSRFSRGFIFEDEANARKFVELTRDAGISEPDLVYNVQREGPPLVPARQGEGRYRAPSPAEAGHLFAAAPVPGAPLAQAISAVRIAPAVRGTLRTGFPVVDTAEKAAHTFAALRKSPRERFQVLVLDKADRPIAAMDLFAGTINFANVYPQSLVQAVYQTPGAAKVWIAHNHPSGIPLASASDRALTTTLGQSFGKDIGVELAGHVIVAGQRAAALDANGEPIGTAFAIPAARRVVEVPITERTIKKAGALGAAIDSPSRAREFLSALNPQTPGILFLSTQNDPLAWWPMSVQDMAQLRTGSIETGAGRLFRALGEVNPSQAMIYSPGERSALYEQAVKNVGAALAHLDVRVLDAFATAGDRVMSFAERGIELSSPGPFLMRAELDQESAAPIFYSELARVIAATKQPAAPAAQWKSAIAAMGQKGVKAEEVHWSGINEWLDLQTGRVTKQAILDYLARSGVRVDEAVLGTPESEDPEIRALTDEIEGLDRKAIEAANRLEYAWDDVYEATYRKENRGWSRSVWEAARYEFEDGERGERALHVLSLIPEERREEMFSAVRKARLELDALEEQREAAVEKLDRLTHGLRDARWGQYTLPGGRNYRELLLILAEPLPSKEGLAAREAVFAKYEPQIEALRSRMEGLDASTSPTVWHERQRLSEEMFALESKRDREADEAYTLPADRRGKRFRSGHFEEADLIAHVRFNERADDEGKKVLFIEELQSDWAETGRTRGFSVEEPRIEYRETYDWSPSQQRDLGIKAGAPAWIAYDSDGKEIGTYHAERYARIAIGSAKERVNIPLGPFVTKTESWVALALKRMIRWAAEHDFDRIAWTTGAQQVERYSLARMVRLIEWDPLPAGEVGQRIKIRTDEGIWTLTTGANDIVTSADRSEMVGKPLDEIFGKEVAQKISSRHKGSMTGGELTVGGEGMRAFYDKILPNVANDVLKKLGGGRVTTVNFKPEGARYQLIDADGSVIDDGTMEDTGEPYPREALARMREDHPGSRIVKIEGSGLGRQPGFDITPALRDKALGGVPMFAREGDVRAHPIPTTADRLISTMQGTARMKAHPDYAAAKAGDGAAAQRLVSALVPQRDTDAARAAFGADVVYIGVDQQDRQGHNAIPLVLAEHYAIKTGARASRGQVIQINRVWHTGADAMSRMLHRARFDGPVEAGARYVIVDDVVTLGGTFAELADHIQANGGQVVGFVSLVNASRGATIRPSESQLAALSFKGLTHAIRTLFGIEPRALTRPEALYLGAFRDADSLRARADAAGFGADLFGSRSAEAPRLSREPGQEGRVGESHEGPQASEAEIRYLAVALDRIAGAERPSPASAYQAAPLPPGILAIARALGVRAYGFRTTQDAATSPQGVFLADRIWINVEARRPALSILFHELLHKLRQDNPALFVEFYEALRPYVTNYPQWFARLDAMGYGKERGSLAAQNDEIREEFMAEVMADGAMHESFWETLGRHNPTLLGKVWAIVKAMIERVRAAIGYDPKMGRYLTDYDRVMRIAGTVVAKYAAAQRAARNASPDAKLAIAAGADVRFARKELDEPAKRAGLKARAQAVIDAIDRALEPIGGLPDRIPYLKERYSTQGMISYALDVGRLFYDAFRKASAADQRAVFFYLISRDGRPDTIRAPGVRDMAVKAKRMIMQVGEALVEAGMLREETVAARQGKYLPQLYLRSLLSEADYAALGTGKKPSAMGYLKQRKIEWKVDEAGELTLISRETGKPLSREEVLRLGPITDPGYLTSVAVTRALRDMALLEWLEKISQNEQWALSKSVIEWRGKRVTPWWLKHEAAALRRQADYYSEEDGKKARAIADEMDRAANDAIGALSWDEKDWAQMPNTARYGRLRGLVVRKEIFEDIVGTGTFMTSTASRAERLLGYGGYATKATQFWKAMKVSMNLPSQVRNGVSNLILLHLSGVSMVKVLPRIAQAARAIHNNEKIWQEARARGISANTFAANELIRIETEMRDLERQFFGPVHWIHAVAAIGKLMDKASYFYQRTEALFKLAKIIDETAKGRSIDDAVIEANKWLFDYSLVSQSIRYLRNAPIGAPFLCVSDDTEILTQRGWLNLDQVRVGDMAASFNMQTERLEWKPVLDVYRADYGGKELLYVEDRHLDMAMTPDHRCVTYRRRRVPGLRAEQAMFPSLEIVRAHELNSRDMIPTAARFDHRPVGEAVPDAIVELVGWYVTEGSAPTNCANVKIHQNEGARAAWIRQLLRDAGFTWREEKRRFANGNAEHVIFTVHADFGRVLRSLAPGKNLVPEFLMRLTVSQIKRLVDAMIAGDGHTTADGERRFLQNPGVTLETFQMALTMLGISYNVRPHNANARAVLLRSGKRYSTKRARFERRPYYGRVWCPMVADNETWVARRNGKPFITHNTFTTKVFPRLLEVALHHPWRFLPYVALAYSLPMIVASMLGVDEDDLDKLKRLLPEAWQTRGHVYILPWKDEAGRWQALDLSYFMPWSAFDQMIRELAAGKPVEAAKSLGVLGGPVPDLLTAIKTGVDPFTGRELAPKGAPPGLIAGAWLTYALNMALPPMFSSYGVVGIDLGDPNSILSGALPQALAGETNRFGDPRATLPQATGRIVGVNIRGVHPTHDRAMVARQLAREIEDTKAAMRRQLADQSLTPDQRKAIMDQYVEEMLRRQKKAMDFLRETELPAALRQ